MSRKVWNKNNLYPHRGYCGYQVDPNGPEGVKSLFM